MPSVQRVNNTVCIKTSHISEATWNKHEDWNQDILPHHQIQTFRNLTFHFEKMAFLDMSVIQGTLDVLSHVQREHVNKVFSS